MTASTLRRSFSLPLVAALGAVGLVGGGLTSEATAEQTSPTISGQSAASITGSWSALGTGVDGRVNALAIIDDTVFAAGRFDNAGGSPVGKIAAWDQSSWSDLEGGVSSNTDLEVSTLLAVDDTLFVGGVFTDAGGVGGFNRIASWARGAWSPLSSGIDDSEVVSLAWGSGLLYVGGIFSSASSVPGTSSIAAWNGSTFSGLDGGITDPGASFSAIAATNVDSAGRLVVGGRFANLGTGPSDDTNVGTWDPNSSTWLPMANGVDNPSSNSPVAAIAPRHDSVIVGGNLTTAGSIATTGLAVWNGSEWSDLGGGIAVDCGMGNFVTVTALAYDSRTDLLYVGGNFCEAGGQTMNLITAWDFGIESWIPFDVSDDTRGLTPNVGGRVNALVVDGTDVYVGGTFTSAGGVVGTSNIARWTWDAPTGANSLVASPGETVSISGSRFIGVPDTGGVFIGGVPVSSYTRVSTEQITGVVVPNGVSGTVAIEVDAAGGRGVVGTLTVPPPRPAEPPGAVSAVGGDQSALVSWVAPSSSGSFPVSNYQVVGSPSGSCLVPAATLSCEVSGLGNGVEYSFRVRALTGAGWGAWSESVSVVPEPPAPEPSILITGSRQGSSVVVEGATTGLVGEQVTPWVRFPGPYSYEAGTGVRTVGVDGTFTWQRQTRKKIYVYFRAGEVKSNRVIIRP